MLALLFRKMLNTKRMVLCLFVGFILAASMFATVPVFMDGSLQRTLVKELQGYQEESGTYSGEYSVTKVIGNASALGDLEKAVKEIEKDIIRRAKSLDMPLISQKCTISDDYIFMRVPLGDGEIRSDRVRISAVEDFEENINIVEGKMYSKTVTDGVFEIIATRAVAENMRLFCGMEFTLANAFNNSLTPIKAKLVGIYEPKDSNDPYFSTTDDPYNYSFYVDRDLFLGDMVASKTVTLKNINVKCEFDYQKVDINNLDSIVSSLKSDSDYYNANSYTFTMGARSILENYQKEASDLRYILWMLEMPVMLMIAFYLFMASQLNADQESGEIAVFKSRGASRLQILGIYALEGAVLGIATVILAPLLGLIFCKVLGVSNGFLEFVSRKAIPVRLTFSAFKYAFVAVLVFFVTTMLPIIPATKTTIVEHKQKKSGKRKLALWEKCGADFILIGLSLYWLFSYQYKQDKLIEQGVIEATASLDPLIFVASTFFILGSALLFIRIYPLLIKLLYNIGKKFWTPSQYVALTSVSRGGGREKFLMVFLVLTVGLGIFSANSARAINTNSEERIYYNNGADVTITEYWRGVYSSEDDENSALEYEEPDFNRFLALDGVEDATKVLKVKDIIVATKEGKANGIEMMAVIPNEFGKIAWYRNDLYPTHFYNYLNALTSYKSGALVSKAYADANGIGTGDTISVRWGSNDAFDVTVLALVEYWPSINPYEANGFVILNYDYANLMTSVSPYSVFIKMKDGATSKALYESIEASGMKITELCDSSQQIIKAKNDPELQGMNGAMTMGFIIIMFTTVVGFLIYWVIEIKSRTLQFGILRAMGMSFREVLMTLFYEQILVSLMSVIIAIVIGGIASDLFVPLFSSMYSVAEQVPPLVAMAKRADYIKIYVIIFAMLGAGYLVLGRLVRKIKISQALKLGED